MCDLWRAVSVVGKRMSKLALFSFIFLLALIGYSASGVMGSALESAPISEPAPSATVQDFAQSSTQDYRIEPFSMPLGLFEIHKDIEHIRERERKADRDQADNLDVQRTAASAAAISAEAGIGQERAAWGQLIIAAIGSVALLYSLWLTRHALTEASRSNGIARAALAASQRAWVKTSIVLDGDFIIRRHTAELSVIAVNENIGNSPALRVHTLISEVADLYDVPSAVERLCEEAKSFDGGRYGITLLPGDKFHRPWYLTLTLDDFKNSSPDGKVAPLIVCCVTYETPNDVAKHQTCSVFMVGTQDGNLRDSVNFIEIEKGGITRDELRIAPWAGGHAD